MGRRSLQDGQRMRIEVGVGFDILYVHWSAIDERPTDDEAAARPPWKDGMVRRRLLGRHLVDSDEMQQLTVELRNRTECRITEASCASDDGFEYRLN
jgi:hypothetical protein